MPSQLFPSWQDKEVIASIYRFFKYPDMKVDPYEFANDIGWRIYTEWCLESEQNRANYLSYEGQAFQKFVDDEVAYLLERQRMGGTRLHNTAVNEKDYQTVRNQVLGGLVRRALNLRAKCVGLGSSGENLRCDLKPWIGE